MEGIALGTEFIGSVFAHLGGVALLAFVASAVLFGHMAEIESNAGGRYSTVTLFARFLGWSTSVPLSTAMW